MLRMNGGLQVKLQTTRTKDVAEGGEVLFVSEPGPEVKLTLGRTHSSWRVQRQETFSNSILKAGGKHSTAHISGATLLQRALCHAVKE